MCLAHALPFLTPPCHPLVRGHHYRITERTGMQRFFKAVLRTEYHLSQIKFNIINIPQKYLQETPNRQVLNHFPHEAYSKRIEERISKQGLGFSLKNLQQKDPKYNTFIQLLVALIKYIYQIIWHSMKILSSYYLITEKSIDSLNNILQMAQFPQKKNLNEYS